MMPRQRSGSAFPSHGKGRWFEPNTGYQPIMIIPRSPRRFRHYGSPVKEDSMFMQMRSRRRGPSKPCPCGGTCSCHKPRKEPWGLIIFSMLFVFGGPILLAFWMDSHRSTVRHIQVNGQDCTIQHVTDSCTSTGACRGHDIAVCPTGK